MNRLYMLKDIRIVLILLVVHLYGCGDDNNEPELPTEGAYDLFVTSSETNAVNRYNGDTGEFMEIFIGPEAGLVNPQELLISYDGQLLVSSLGNPRVMKFNVETGEFLGNFTQGYSLVGPTKMKFSKDSLLYVSQWSNGQSSVAEFDGVSGQFIREVTQDHNTTMGQAFDEEFMYVAVFDDGQVLQYDKEGNFVKVFSGSNFLQGPVNVIFRDDLLYVEDWSAGAIKRFDPVTGSTKGTFISGLNNVEGSVIGPDGFLYVCEWNGGVVKKYNASTGILVERFTEGGVLDTPNSLVFRKR